MSELRLTLLEQRNALAGGLRVIERLAEDGLEKVRLDGSARLLVSEVRRLAADTLKGVDLTEGVPK